MAEPESVELRGQCVRNVVNVLDAVSANRRITRWDLVAEILEAWADDKMREVTAICRVVGVDEPGRNGR